MTTSNIVFPFCSHDCGDDFKIAGRMRQRSPCSEWVDTPPFDWWKPFDWCNATARGAIARSREKSSGVGEERAKDEVRAGSPWKGKNSTTKGDNPYACFFETSLVVHCHVWPPDLHTIIPMFLVFTLLSAILRRRPHTLWSHLVVSDKVWCCLVICDNI